MRRGQEKFWQGKFGDEYAERNDTLVLRVSNLRLFAEILSHTYGVESVIEHGANRGLNLDAIKALLPDAKCSAVEINESALQELRSSGHEAIPTSILDFEPSQTWDFVLTKGLLIHIAPENLPKAYEVLYRSAKNYICLIEYFNPTSIEIAYRGNQNKLFKRDFAGEMLDEFQDLRLIAYGFVYKRDNNFKQDNLNWFLMEKR